MVGPIDVNIKEMSQPDATLTMVHLTLTLTLKLYFGNGRPDCHGTKGTGVNGMPWCETLRKWVNWMLRWLGYLWPRPLTLNFESQIVSREWEARLSWNERDGIRWDALMWNTKEMSPLDAVLTGVLLTLNFEGQIVSQEWCTVLCKHATWTFALSCDRASRRAASVIAAQSPARWSPIFNIYPITMPIGCTHL